MTDSPTQHPRRLGRIPWRKDAPREAYDRLYDQLCTVCQSQPEAETCMNLFCHFVLDFNARDAPATLDLSRLTATSEDAARARTVWDAMCQRGRWSPKHRAEVRTRLARALWLVVPGLAYVVNPTMRRTASIRFQTHNSHRTDFDLHECLPYAVRRLGDLHVEYRLLARVGQAMSDHMRSVSRNGLYQLLLFFDPLIHGRGVLPSLWPTVDPDLEARWNLLRTLTAMDWLRRYRGLFPQFTGGTPRTISFALLRRELRWLSAFHHRVLHGAAREVVSIPTPRPNGRIGAMAPGPLGNMSSDEDDLSGGTDVGDARSTMARQALTEEICALRGAVVQCTHASDVVKTFSPDEVRRIVMAAESTRERLVIMLLLTTGLRRGGIARLRGPPVGTVVRHARDVPLRLCTTEKSNVTREVRLSPMVRILVAHWYRHCRPTHPNPYLFPGSKHKDGHVEEAWVARVCAGVLRRADVTGAAAHTHSFHPRTPVCPHTGPRPTHGDQDSVDQELASASEAKGANPWGR